MVVSGAIPRWDRGEGAERGRVGCSMAYYAGGFGNNLEGLIGDNGLEVGGIEEPTKFRPAFRISGWVRHRDTV